jgi:hypothetical protein
MKAITIFFLILLTGLNTSVAFSQGREKRIAPIDTGKAAQFNRAQTVGVAVLVGVGKYPRYGGLSELRYPARDVDLVGATLDKQRYLVFSLKDSDATKASVLNAIKQAGEAVAGENLTLVFFFSGHGFAVDGENYLATLDADSNNLAKTGLSVKTVEKALQATGAARRVMWLDACRDEPGKSAVAPRSFASLQASAGTRLLLSTMAGKTSYEDDTLQQGMFSYFLVRGLNGEAAGPDGLVTFQDLATYVTQNVRARSVKAGHVQVPYEAGEASGDFLLAHMTGAAPPAAPTSTPVPSPAPVIASAEEAWRMLRESMNPQDFDDFVKQFPNSAHASVATLRAAQLRRAGTAPVTHSAAVSSCISPPSGLAGWWPGDGTPADIAGNSNPTGMNAVTFASGKVGEGFAFGQSGYLAIPASPRLASQRFTWSAWVRPDGPGPNNDKWGNVIVGQNIDNSHASVALGWSANGSRFSYLFGSIQKDFIFSKDVFPPGQFYFVAGTYDGSAFRLFVNGVPEGNFPAASAVSYSAKPWTIGSSNPQFFPAWRRTWNGVIDELQVFDRALSQNELLAIANAGIAGECKRGSRVSP